MVGDPEVGVPEVRLENIHWVPECAVSHRNGLPELALEILLATRTAIGREVDPPDQPRRCTDRGTGRMLVEKSSEKGGAGEGAPRHAQIADRPTRKVCRVVLSYQSLRSFRMCPVEVARQVWKGSASS